MSTSSSFNEALLEKKLLQLRETHESISSLSSWCLANQAHHSKIVTMWLSVLRRVKIEHRLLLFYLANDVIQYSRRKHLPFVEAFAPVLQKATTMVREDSVKNKVLRLFKIWDDRGIYDEAFLLDLSGLLICDPKGSSRMDIQDFQPNVMYSRIRSCKKLEDDTDNKLRILNESEIPITNVDKLRKTLKDREHSEDVMEDVEQALTKIKAYIDALEAEIKERSGLLDMLDTSEQYYEKDFKEAKIVVNAYKCFGQRVKQVQKKLEEKMPSLPSPVPSPPDVNAPSPSPPQSPDDVNVANFNPGSFTMGDSFINNTSVIEKALDSNNSFYGEKDFYNSAVYTPSMTTHPRDSTPYTPSGKNYSANTSFSSQYGSTENDYNPNHDDYNRNYNSDSQPSHDDSYPAEYFIGGNSKGYSEERVQPNVFSSLMNSEGGLLPPPPPPPLPTSPTPNNPGKPDGNKIEVIGVQPSLADIIQSLSKKETKPAEEEREEWNEEWDSPLSPPPFQEEYPTIDTDMRAKDVDHRNLISLTGWDSKPESDKDSRPFRSLLFHDSDSSDSRSPPDHIPPLNLIPPSLAPPPSPPSLPATNVPPPKLLPPPGLPPSLMPPNFDDSIPPLQSNLPPAFNNIPPPNFKANLANPNGPPNFEMTPPNFQNIRPPNFNNSGPPQFVNRPHFAPNGPPPPHFTEESHFVDNMDEPPYDNVENIDMEMSDEERETSPVNKRPGLVPITPEEDEVPPPVPLTSIPKPFPPPHRMPRFDSPRLESPRPPRMNLPERHPLTPSRPPLESPRPPRPNLILPHQDRSPRPPPRFFHQGPRPFRPRHFRPRFQPRW